MHNLHIVAIGAFGKAVASRLAGDNVVCDFDSALTFLPDTAVRVVVAWRPVPALFSSVDHLAFETGVPWFPVVQQHPVIRIGPSVVPGIGPCYYCAQRRFLQHEESSLLDEALLQFYSVNSTVGPTGYLPPVVSIVAATVKRVVQRLATDPSAEAGRVRQLNVVSLETTMGTVAGIHGCTRCGPPQQTTDSFVGIPPARGK